MIVLALRQQSQAMNSGRGTIAESVKAMKAGAVDYLTKPVVVLQRLAKLTRRERETLKLMTKGLFNKQIANVMGTTEKTIKVHRMRVFKKMGAKNAAEVVRMTAEYL
jgi:FixJ family two-component response regulator